jgi:hypothetical protein
MTTFPTLVISHQQLTIVHGQSATRIIRARIIETKLYRQLFFLTSFASTPPQEMCLLTKLITIAPRLDRGPG